MRLRDRIVDLNRTARKLPETRQAHEVVARTIAERTAAQKGIAEATKCSGENLIPDFWQVGVVLKPEGPVPQTSHRAWPPEGLCI
jgi:hypothetical protein